MLSYSFFSSLLVLLVKALPWEKEGGTSIFSASTSIFSFLFSLLTGVLPRENALDRIDACESFDSYVAPLLELLASALPRETGRSVEKVLSSLLGLRVSSPLSLLNNPLPCDTERPWYDLSLLEVLPFAIISKSSADLLLDTDDIGRPFFWEADSLELEVSIFSPGLLVDTEYLRVDFLPPLDDFSKSLSARAPILLDGDPHRGPSLRSFFSPSTLGLDPTDRKGDFRELSLELLLLTLSVDLVLGINDRRGDAGGVDPAEEASFREVRIGDLGVAS